MEHTFWNFSQNAERERNEKWSDVKRYGGKLRKFSLQIIRIEKGKKYRVGERKYFKRWLLWIFKNWLKIRIQWHRSHNGPQVG